jgi:hypothetical protein
MVLRTKIMHFSKLLTVFYPLMYVPKHADTLRSEMYGLVNSGEHGIAGRSVDVTLDKGRKAVPRFEVLCYDKTVSVQSGCGNLLQSTLTSDIITRASN